MKRIITFVCTLVVLLFYVSPPYVNAAGNLKEISQNSPFQMTVLGDSIAAGYGLEGHDRENEPCYECASYANTLAEKYGLIPGTTYFNDAVSGATTSDLIKALDNTEILKHLNRSDTILISIGGNDLLQVLWSAFGSENGMIQENDDGSGYTFNAAQILSVLSTLGDNVDAALEGFEQNFNTIIDKIRNSNPGALVIVSTLYDPFQGSETFKPVTEISSDALKRFNAIIKDNATDSDGNTRYIVADVAGSFGGKEAELTNIADFDIHPNAAGHAEIAALLDTEISSHTFTTWVLDTSASADESQLTEEEKQEKKRYASLMIGLFFMLMIMITALFIHSMNKLKNQ